MFRILQTEAERPATFIAAPDDVFQPGNIGQLYEVDGLVVCGLSNGSNPYGLIDTTKAHIDKQINYAKDNLVKLWIQRAVFMSDLFEVDAKYDKECALYVSRRGLITSVCPRENAYPVARMITPPSHKHPYFEGLWL